MLKALAWCALFSFSMLPYAAVAEPIKLKLSYFTSDTEVFYRCAVKPFVDRVNAAANGLIEIDAFTSGSLGKSYAGQTQLVLDGVADLAFVNPGLTPEQLRERGSVKAYVLQPLRSHRSAVSAHFIARPTLHEQGASRGLCRP